MLQQKLTLNTLKNLLKNIALNWEVLNFYLCFSFIPAPFTFFRNIYKLKLNGTHREWYSLPVTKLFIDLSWNEGTLFDWSRDIYHKMKECNTSNYFLEKCLI